MENQLYGLLDDLYLFSIVTECGSVHAASRKLNIPSSTLSRRLSSLEASLGAKLLTKEGRALVVTPMGSAMLETLNTGIGLMDSSISQLKSQYIMTSVERYTYTYLPGFILASLKTSFRTS